MGDGRINTMYLRWGVMVCAIYGWDSKYWSEAWKQSIPKRDSLKYLGFVIQENRNIDNVVTYHIGVAWMKWRLVSRFLCDQKVPPNFKGIFYKMVIRSTLLYGEKCWPIKNFHVQKMHVAKIKTMRWICGISTTIKIGKNYIQNKVELTLMAER